MLRICLLVCLILVGTAFAQQQVFTEQQGIALVDAYADDEIIVSVPEGWLVFRRADYRTLDAAVRAQQRLYNRVDRNLEANPSLVDLITLSATRPQLAATFPIQMFVIVFPLEQIAAEIGVDANDLIPEQVAQALNYSSSTLDVNGRRVSAGYQFDQLASMAAVYVFTEQEKVVVITFPTTNDYLTELEPMMAAVLLSVRLEGEPFDLEAWQTFLHTDESLPDYVTFASAEPEATPESTADPEATAEVTAEAAVCILTAFNNVNLRGGPGTDYNVRDLLEGGATVGANAQTQSADGWRWWRVGDERWVREDGVEEFGECDTLPMLVQD